mmetsp:Transcript_8053/g.23881  ORF Transcript_8053/g.23881 Transcript_8053/m.23881 type:complete len:250 (-) Transcript_8053:7576-8325(-)
MAEHIPSWAVLPRDTGRWLLTQRRDGPQHEGPPQTWTIDDKPAYLIGRNGQVADILVDHMSSSRVHACLAFDSEGAPHLIDLNSAHGTLLKGKRMQKGGRAQLQPGDDFSIAACPQTFCLSRRKHAPVVFKPTPAAQSHAAARPAERGDGSGGGGRGSADVDESAPRAVSRWEDPADEGGEGRPAATAAARAKSTSKSRSKDREGINSRSRSRSRSRNGGRTAGGRGRSRSSSSNNSDMSKRSHQELVC